MECQWHPDGNEMGRRSDGRVDVLDGAMASCCEEVATLIAGTTKTRTAVAAALAALTADLVSDSVVDRRLRSRVR